MASTKSKSKSGSDLAAKVGIGALGAAIGGAIALLFAPGSGKKTRAKVVQEGKKVARATAKTVKEIERQAGIAPAPAARRTVAKRPAAKKK